MSKKIAYNISYKELGISVIVGVFGTIIYKLLLESGHDTLAILGVFLAGIIIGYVFKT